MQTQVIIGRTLSAVTILINYNCHLKYIKLIIINFKYINLIIINNQYK